MTNKKVLIGYCIICLIGVIVGIFSYIPLRDYIIEQKVQDGVRVEKRKKMTNTLDAKRLQTHSFKKGCLAQLFAADSMKTLDSTHIEFINPVLYEFHLETKFLKSEMRADRAVMQVESIIMNFSDFEKIEWRGNFQYFSYQLDDERVCEEK